MKSKRALLGLVVCIALVCGGHASASPATRRPHRARAAHRLVTHSAQSARLAFGYNDDSFERGMIGAGDDARLEAEAGSNVVRVPFNWLAAEPQPGEFDFTQTDAIHAAMSARGLRVLWNVIYAPSWTWAPSETCHAKWGMCPYPPSTAHLPDAEAAAAALAARYPDAAGIEVWNEENITDFWQARPDPGIYLKLLRAVYSGVKQVVPTMPVVMGGLAAPTRTVGGDMALGDYLARLLAAGAGEFTDAIAIHDYPDPFSGQGFGTVIAQARAVRDHFRLSRKPLWITETGVSTSFPGAPTSEDMQANRLGAIYDTAARERDIRMLIVNRLVPTGPSRTAEPGYAVLLPDLTPAAAFCTLARLRLPHPIC